MKRIICLCVVLLMCLTQYGCAWLDSGESGEDDYTYQSSTASVSSAAEDEDGQSDTSAGTESETYWQFVGTEDVVPENYFSESGKDSLRYTFYHNGNNIEYNYIKKLYDGIKKVDMYESIQTKCSFALLDVKERYAPGDVLRLRISAEIMFFKRVNMNYTGASVYVYIASLDHPFNLPTDRVFKNSEGDSTCSATIKDGEITTAKDEMIVEQTLGQATPGTRTAVCAVADSLGKVGGRKFIFECKQAE